MTLTQRRFWPLVPIGLPLWQRAAATVSKVTLHFVTPKDSGDSQGTGTRRNWERWAGGGMQPMSCESSSFPMEDFLTWCWETQWSIQRAWEKNTHMFQAYNHSLQSEWQYRLEVITVCRCHRDTGLFCSFEAAAMTAVAAWSNIFFPLQWQFKATWEISPENTGLMRSACSEPCNYVHNSAYPIASIYAHLHKEKKGHLQCWL